MPHQLRRIVTINIRNPNGGLPSGRIAELDPRGGVLAVGVNGVGKTTFLRLLPLFYGATPTQILKGTGHSLMISHTLPDASSAICYEYERETDSDLRCVVVHAKPNEEAPQFHIIHGGFREEYFYDDSNQYVSRDDFKPRVEAMGVEVSRKLFLHQYRSVILNERLNTKEGLELRRLAAVHSLGPRPLYNLEQIAAAMSNEKISFRDLQNIVLERVSDSADSSGQSVRELKQNREAVIRWLEARNHMADITKRKPDAIQIGQRIVRIKKLHTELCSLHISVKEAVIAVSKELGVLQDKITSLQEEFTKESDALQLLLTATVESKRLADLKMAEKDAAVMAIEAQKRHFDAIKADDLERLQSLENDLLSQKVAKEIELHQLQGAAGDSDRQAEDRRKKVHSSFAEQVSQVDTRLQSVLKDFAARSDGLSDALTAALDAVATPVRLSEIPAERLTMATRLGELKPLIERATASPATLKELDDADKELTHAGEVHDKARLVTETARAAADNAKEISLKSLSKVRHLEEASSKHGVRISELEAQLTPASGSMLEFIRKGDPAIWEQAGRLLDEGLLTRTDLEPVYLDDDDASLIPVGSVRVGTTVINVTNIPIPSWVQMASIKADLDRAKEQSAALSSELEAAKTTAKRHSKEYADLLQTHSSTQANESLANSALVSARANKTRLTRFAELEATKRKQDAVNETKALESKSRDLDGEIRRIEGSLELTRTAIRKDFKAQRNHLSDEQAKSERQLTDEKDALRERKSSALAQIDADLARTLAGLGIDSQRLARLLTEVDSLGAQLGHIASNRHEVEAWRKFKRDVLPTLVTQRDELLRQREECDRLSAKRTDLNESVEALKKRAQRDLETLALRVSSRQNEQLRLNALLDQGLKNFLDYFPTSLHIDWTVPDLESALRVRQHDLASEVGELQKEFRSLHNEIVKHNGGPSDWLNLKEKSLPDPQTLLGHQYLCAQAQVACDWFDPSESGPYIDQLTKEMLGFYNLAGEFVRVLDQFERSVSSFNRELQKALNASARFERFRDLSVTVSSSIGQLGYIKVLRQMQDKGNRNPLAYRSSVRSEVDVPSDEDATLVRTFRDLLQGDGGFRVNLNEQVRLECNLYENGVRRTISNEEEFRGVSSNGNSALITAMFLIGFIQMIRGDSPVRLTWVTDEVGRFDAGNLSAFLQTLDMHKIDVVSASPSLDPALARYFKRICMFEGNGAVYAIENDEVTHDQT